MYTYLTLNLVFLVLATALNAKDISALFSKPRILAVVILCMLTLIFDNLIIASGIVAYNEDQLLGIRLGLAPIEDFFYPVVAVILLPFIWDKLSRKS